MISNISLHVSEGSTPSAEVLTLESGDRFIVFRPDGDLVLILGGHGMAGVAHARALADVLTAVANKLEAAEVVSV